jgi:putative addiction module component (TIGR02574 family)
LELLHHISLQIIPQSLLFGGMSSGIAIERMSLDEKLDLMESLWENLSRNPQSLPMPQWQKDLLDKRAREIQEGSAKFSDWKSAKARIKKRCS